MDISIKTNLPKVICGFPGIGKTEAFKMQKDIGFKLLDSDSSKFSTTTELTGMTSRKAHNMRLEVVRNPEFPVNYVNYIFKMIFDRECDYMLASTHSEVRDELAKRGIPYDLIYPSHELKDAYMQRYKARKSPDRFIELMDKCFDKFVDGCERDKHAYIKVVLVNPDEYLSDYLGFINRWSFSMNIEKPPVYYRADSADSAPPDNK